MKRYIIDPDAKLDFVFDWSAWLGSGETITTATVTADGPITVAPANRPTVVGPSSVTVWLTGATAGQSYRVTCRISTSAGRIDDRSIHLICTER